MALRTDRPSTSELHRQQGDNLQVDHELDVADMGIDEQVAAVMKIWTAG